MKDKRVHSLFEKRTGVKYQNWIQAWSVTEKQKRKKNMNMEPVIKTGLWMMSIVCLYNVLTTFDNLVFSISVFMGLFSTWILIRWDRIVEPSDYPYNTEFGDGKSKKEMVKIDKQNLKESFESVDKANKYLKSLSKKK